MSERIGVEIKKNQGIRLKAIRKHFKVSQQIFSSQIGINKATLAHYEIGRRLIGSEALLSIWRVYGVDPLMVLGEKELKFK